MHNITEYPPCGCRCPRRLISLVIAAGCMLYMSNEQVAFFFVSNVKRDFILGSNSSVIITVYWKMKIEHCVANSAIESISKYNYK